MIPPPSIVEAASIEAARVRWSADGPRPGARSTPVETAVAIVHDASTTAVLMATPHDLEDLALGFTLTEGIVDTASAVREIEMVRGDLGWEARIWLAADAGARLAARRRRIVGPTGCGLCGVESLEEASRVPRLVDADLGVTAGDLLAAMAGLQTRQTLGDATRAVHAAGFWTPGEGLGPVREDVGRHNALDKLAGALGRTAIPAVGIVLLTSRVSVEMVQKTAAIGAPILCAVSAPTDLAIRTAEAAGVTLVAIARRDGFEVFTRPDRIAF